MLCRKTLGHDAKDRVLFGNALSSLGSIGSGQAEGERGEGGKQWCQKHVNGTEDLRQHRAAQKPSGQAGENAKGYCMWG